MDAWISLLRDAEIPVKSETAEALEVMRDCEDSVDANLIGEMIGGDPLMTLKVLVFAAKNRSVRAVTQPETVTSSLVMLGISPFFRSFQQQPTLEEFLNGQGEALKGINRVLRRASRAANFALAFAVRRAAASRGSGSGHQGGRGRVVEVRRSLHRTRGRQVCGATGVSIVHRRRRRPQHQVLRRVRPVGRL
jgi:hypothetical protein